MKILFAFFHYIALDKNCSYYIKASQLIHFANKLTGFYVTGKFFFRSRQFSMYLKGITFRGYLISRLEKNYILWVFNFAIW